MDDFALQPTNDGGSVVSLSLVFLLLSLVTGLLAFSPVGESVGLVVDVAFLLCVSCLIITSCSLIASRIKADAETIRKSHAGQPPKVARTRDQRSTDGSPSEPTDPR